MIEKARVHSGNYGFTGGRVVVGRLSVLVPISNTTAVVGRRLGVRRLPLCDHLPDGNVVGCLVSETDLNGRVLDVRFLIQPGDMARAPQYIIHRCTDYLSVSDTEKNGVGNRIAVLPVVYLLHDSKVMVLLP